MFSRIFTSTRSLIPMKRFSSTEATSIPKLFDKMTIIGGGNMSEAIIASLSKSKKQTMSDVSVVEPVDSRREYLSTTYGVNALKDINIAVAGAQLIIVAVKPQNIEEVGLSITTPLAPNSIVLSIAAGYAMPDLARNFKTNSIMRCMPNTPAAVLQGMSVYIASDDCDSDTVDKAEEVLKMLGEVVRVSKENYLDMATAVSGSGPAYVFLAMESMIEAAVHVGFPRHVAQKLVIQTIKGSATVAEQSEVSIPELRNSVTSPGGTTASALYALENGGFRTVVADAIWAAYRRSLELGGNNSNVGPGRATP